MLAPILVGITGIVVERLFISRLYHLDHLYGLLLTFGLALVLEGCSASSTASPGCPTPIRCRAAPTWASCSCRGTGPGWWSISLVVCLATWFLIERTKLGSYLRAATERPDLVQAFGINVPRMITLTYGFGVGLAALAGVLAAPIYSVNPVMGANLIIVVFAVVVIGGMGSIMGVDRDGIRPRRDRGPNEGVLPRGLQHRDLRHHGDRADAAARRACSERRGEAVA